MLTEVDQSEFAAMHGALDVSASVLSKHLKVLEDAGYLKLTQDDDRLPRAHPRGASPMPATGRSRFE
jgi:DNA-binding transcriptional ArsR family regulator